MNKFKLHNLVLSIALCVCANQAVAADASLLDETHATMGMTCVDCHGEADRQPVVTAKCTECHDVADLAEATAVTPSVTATNPHDHRHNGTATNCNACHNVHKPSVNVCGDCHLRFELVVP
ncbi:cytochrome c3 family protein [Ferrimonas lipolytica]|uniref:Cytochrome c3 family protein n=1 Tax=Ferrimonas lipolytica TaxID=2724191 RepID=A0A6H1UDW5_9GAMM|nr:cytochrome c3 family protein [Ferrimonas lipolytica]QIZ77271.1 cytochrome c3 family protein [Ferrimonas lipolytica]